MIPRAKWARPKCFTLIELIVVLVILGVLAALAIPTFNAIRNRGAETVALSDATTIARAATATFALYEGEDGPINPSGANPYPCTGGLCNEDDAVRSAALESGFVDETGTLTKGDTELTGTGPWTVTGAVGTDNASVACISFEDQAFTATSKEVTDPENLPSCP